MLIPRPTYEGLDRLEVKLGRTTANAADHPWITALGIGMIEGVEGYVVYARNLKEAKRHVPKDWEGVTVHIKKMSKPRPAKKK
jgi:hypothetical protein